MKKTLLFLTLFIFSWGFSQAEIKTDYVAAYDIKYKHLGKKTSEQVLLFMDAKNGESLFEGTNNYVLDSLITAGKISATDPMAQVGYTSNFNEVVYNKNSQLRVYEKIVGAKVFYDENPKINWIITNESKIHAGLKVTKAYATIFGRKWYAWYADNALPFGPYKFGGLPGLILVMKDAKGEFFIKLTQLKKKRKIVKIPTIRKYKKIKKSQVEKIRYSKQVVRMDQVVIHDNPKDKREWREGLEKSFKEYPRLDIEFPYQP